MTDRSSGRSSDRLRIALAQLNPVVGDIAGNLTRARAARGQAAPADVILFSQCHLLGQDWRLETLRRHSLTRAYPSKVMVYDERDVPWGAFPGIYVSMPSRSFHWPSQRPW